ncbi:MAG: cellulase family glycosylhydrolase, partial [Solirubrobacteraceae bacterium]
DAGDLTRAQLAVRCRCFAVVGRFRILIITGLAAAALAVPAARAGAATSVITIAHHQLLRNGLPWVPRGVQIVGLVAPDGALSDKYIAAHAQFGYAELQAAVAAHADLVRFQVSQFGLDPQGPLYSPAYVDEVANAVQTARWLGLAVILSLQAQPPAGQPTRCPLPDAGAERAWESLSTMFGSDGDVMFELYNEPGVSATPAGWIQWRAGGEIIYPSGACQAVGMQTLINEIRTQAPGTVIIVPGLKGEQSLAGRMRIVDPAHRSDPQLAYGVHYPSLSRGVTFWDKTFGTTSAAVPVIVTEWDGNSTTNCVPNTPAVAQLLLDYLASKRIGIVGFAFDLPGTIVADSTFTPTSYEGFACGVPGGGPGQILFADFAAEAQAGDGTQPDPTPAWIVSANLLSRLQLVAHDTAAHFFNTPRTFVTGASATSLALLGMSSAVPATSFTDERRLAAAITTRRLQPGTAAIVYAAGAIRGTPVAQQRNPAHYYALAARIAHAHGLLFIAAPQTSLVKALAPATPAAARDVEFLRLGLPKDTARDADAFEAPAQATQDDSSAFASFVASASRQAARSHRGIELLAGLSAGAARSTPSPDTLFDAFLSTRLTVAGYGFSGPSPAATSAGLAFLRKLERLDT